MVYFVCEGCNETLKKNQVDKHAYSCRSCQAVTCVDCSVTFYGDDYAAHTTCISEAEKYEKSLFKPKANAKPKPQDIWNTLIEDIVSMKSQAPPGVQPYLQRLSTLNNVPRNQKKFMNFSKNSLNIRDDKLLELMWKFLDSCRAAKEKEVEAPSATTSSSSSSKPHSDEKKETDDNNAVNIASRSEGEEKKKKVKKEKKRSREEAEEQVEGVRATATEEDVEGKKKKKKKDIAESDTDKLQKEVEIEVKEESKKEKKEKKQKKEKKSAREE